MTNKLIESIQPEFVDLKTLEVMFGIKRSLAYELMGKKIIKGIAIRQGEEKKGKRLIQVASVRGYLNELMQDQNPE